MSEPLPDRAETVVVGAGAVGLAVAYELAVAGREVVVVERDEPGRGTSWGNCGLITPSYADPFTRFDSLLTLARSLPDPAAPIRIAPSAFLRRPGWFLGFAARCREGHRLRVRPARLGLLQSSRRRLAEIIEAERIDCAWRTGGLTALFKTPEPLRHHVEVQRLFEEAGLAITLLDGDAIRREEPLVRDDVIGAVRMEGDAHLDPGRFAVGLAEAARRRGATVLSGTEVETIADGRVATARGVIAADHVVVAAGPWTPAVAGGIGLKLPIEPVKGYSITWPTPLRGLRGPLLFYERRVVATPWPHGFRLGSTMEFTGYDESLNERRLDRLLDGARAYLNDPLALGRGEPWCGWRPMVVDELPIVGPSSRVPGLWWACGHGQLGMSMAPATGQLLAELIRGEKPHLDPRPFAPARFRL